MPSRKKCRVSKISKIPKNLQKEESTKEITEEDGTRHFTRACARSLAHIKAQNDNNSKSFET